MNVGVAFVADPQPGGLVQPGERALDDPALDPRAVLALRPSNVAWMRRPAVAPRPGSAAATNDISELIALVDAIPPVRGRRVNRARAGLLAPEGCQYRCRCFVPAAYR